jgi:hypothetical protein
MVRPRPVQSAIYQDVGSTKDLDEVREDFCAARDIQAARSKTLLFDPDKTSFSFDATAREA